MGSAVWQVHNGLWREVSLKQIKLVMKRCKCLFQVAYRIRKEIIPFSKFLGLCALLVIVKANILIERLYRNENLCPIFLLILYKSWCCI